MSAIHERFAARMAALFLAAALSSCGGGGGGSTLRGGSGSTPQSATVKVQIIVPNGRTGTSSRLRKPAFFSPSIQSVSIAVSTNTQPTIANLTATSPGCTTSAGAVTCVVTLSALAGSDTFTITSYDQQNATGNVLSTGTLVTLIVAGTNNINVTMNGVVSSINLSLMQPLVPNGSSATSTLVLEAFDPDGNVIVGPGTFSASNGNALTITVSDSDTSGATSINGGASAAVTGPSSAVLTIHSTGALAGGTSVTFTASATGIASVTAILGVGTPGRTIYVADGDYTQINAYLPGSSGNVAPYRSILPTLTFPEQLAYDSSGNIYVTDDNGNNNGTYQERVNVYAPNAFGNAAPIAQIAGPATGLNGIYGVALDSANRVWVANYATNSTLSIARRGGQSSRRSPRARRRIDGAVKPPFIGVWSAGANGNVAPIGIIQGLATTMSRPEAMTFDAAGNLWVTDDGSLSVYEFSAAQLATVISGGLGTPFNAPPAATLSGLTATPYAVGVDAAGNLYVGQCAGASTVLVYAPGNQSGTPIPDRILTGTQCPSGIAFDGAGNVYVSGYTSAPHAAVINVYTAGATGSLTPTRTIAGILPDDENCFAGLGANAGRVDVLDSCAMSLYSYPSSASGTPTPSRIIQGYFAYPCIGSLWEDATGNLYVSSCGSAAGGIAVFAPGASGYAQPTRYITEAGTSDPSYNPFAAVTDSSGNLYALNDPYNGLTLVPNVAIFAPGANGSATPSNVISGVATTLPNFPQGRPQIDPAGNLVVLNSSTGCVDFFPHGSLFGNIAPFQTICGIATGLGPIVALYVDAAGNVYVGQNNGGTTEILEFQSGMYGNTAPLRTITASPVVAPVQDIWVDGSGAIYAAEGATGIAIFPPGASGPTAATVIGGSNSQISNATGIAVGL